MKKILLMLTLVGLVIFGCNYSYARDGITYNDNLTTRTDLNGNSFEYGTITIEHDGDSITMMDRNLGATTNNINNRRSYGYYYQRGNNYGFSSNIDSLTTGENPVDASPYGPGNYYSRDIYNILPRNTIYARDRSTVRNDNLRGGSGDIENNDYGYPVQNPSDRQGPCPNGYHVPSMGERIKVMEWWALNYNGAGHGNPLRYDDWGRPVLSGGISKFRSDFLIPESKSFYTDRSDFENLYNIHESLNYLQSSSSIPYKSGDQTPEGFVIIRTDYRKNRGLWLYNSTIYVGSSQRDMAAPIRCFKNPDNSSVDEDISFSIDIDSTTKVGKTEFMVKVMKDGAIFRDYTGTVYLYLTDKYGNTTDNDIYAFSDGKSYEFKKNDHGKKAFSVKIEEEGTYVLRINDLSNDDIKGSETITVKGNSNNSNFEYDYSKFNPYYSDEMNMAYQYAYHYGITTINNINNANMNGSLNRIAMAKMLSYFAENVLGMDDFDTRRNCEFNDVPSYLDRQYNYGVTKACQLGIMGINMQNNNFNPYGTVTRAQFATALSRLLYGTEDGTYNYYSTHISKLYKEGIISNTNPSLQERRGYVMLMLMRSQDGGLSSNNNNSSTAYHSPNMIDMSNLLFGLSSSDPELTCNRTEKVYREDGRYYRYKSDSKWTADARFVNNVLQTVRNSGQYLVEDYIRQANDVLDSVGLTNENRCRYSFLIYALENQRGELTSYKTQNGITTIGVDFYSYKETLGEYDIDPAGGTFIIYKNTSKKSRNYRLAENPQLEILKVDSNGHTNAVYYFDGPETRSYVSNWNTWINTYCNNEVVYNGKSPDSGNGSNYNWNTNNALCIKNRLSNPGDRSLTFTFDDLGNISKIGGFYYWLDFHS